MSSIDYHLFISYARLDDKDPVDSTGRGWITAFQDHLKTRHRNRTGKELKVFFDTDAIESMTDWRAQLGRGLRSSRIFLAFVSPNYIRSKNCRWEWIEYLRREHTLARGDDGIATVYFVTVPNMPTAYADDPEAMARLEADLRSDQEIAAWMDEISDDLKRRNIYLDPANPSAAATDHPRAAFDLRNWYDGGPGLLEQLDAEERLAELRSQPASDEGQLLRLDSRLDNLTDVIAKRLDRCLLATLASGNLGRSYPHFVGRHAQLIELHHALTTERRGLLTAAHGMGGQGKTALAVQYAFAYAEFYATGGRWIVGCEGKSSLGDALEALALDPDLGLGAIPEAVSVDRDLTARWVLHQLKEFTRHNHQHIVNEFENDSERHYKELPEIQPRMLLIFDNVDCPEILHPDQRALLPAEEWLQIVVTTRLAPDEFEGGSVLHPIAVDSLPPKDALALMREFQPGKRFSSAEEEAAAAQIVDALGGFTLAVELVAAHLGEISAGVTRGITFADFYQRLSTEGLVGEIDEIAGETSVRHASQKDFRFNQISFILDATLATLDADAISVLRHAALMSPDFVVVDWLRQVVEGPDQKSEAESDLSVIERLAPFLIDFTCGDPAQIESVANILGGGSDKQLLIDLMRESASDYPEESRTEILTLLDQLEGSSTESTRTSPGTENRFHKIWRQVRGMRLLTESTLENATMPEQVDPAVPHLARIHRVVAEHILKSISEEEKQATVESGIAIIYRFQRYFETAWKIDPTSHWLLRPLEENVHHFNSRHRPSSHRLALAAGIAAQAHMRIGQLGRAEKLLMLCRGTLKQRHDLDPNDAEITRLLSVAGNELGDFYLSRGQSGDAELALHQFEQSLEIDQSLFEANPNSAQAARDLSVSFDRLGDFYLSRGQSGDAELALQQFEQSLEIDQSLFEANPNSAQAARDLSVSFERLGDFYLSRGQSGDAELALQQFEQSLEIAQSLFEANPNSAQAARDLSVSLNKLGDFYLSRGQSGDAELALQQFEQSLEIAQSLFEANPNSAQAARDLSVSLNKLGDFYLRRGQSGDAELALQQFEQSLEVRQSLFEANPNSAQAARDLSVSLNKLGDFYLSRGQSGDDAELALQQFEQSLEIAQSLFEANPNSAEAARDLVVSHFKLSQVNGGMENPEAAEKNLRICFGILDSFYQQGRPMDPQMRGLHEHLAAMFSAEDG